MVLLFLFVLGLIGGLVTFVVIAVLVESVKEDLGTGGTVAIAVAILVLGAILIGERNLKPSLADKSTTFLLTS